MKIQSFEDLKAIAAQYSETLYAPKHVKVNIGMASCGIAAQAKAAYEKARERFPGNNGVAICQTGCIGFCEEEPLVDIFEAGKPPAGEMELILAAGSSGILLHEAIGHGMEADCNRKNESIFSDKIGKPVAEKFVTIVDNGTNPNLRGTINVDDEANETQETYLVRDGILESYLHDRISSKHYGVKPTGSGRRQSFRFAPIPRMRNTYMLNGPHSKEEIVKSVKKGIIAETFTNGEVRIGPGDFTFYVKSGYLVEDGKITMPIKDFNIIGNGPDVLAKVTMVADDLQMAEGGWTCGKGGQSVPVSMGQPTVKVSSITVGGINS